MKPNRLLALVSLLSILLLMFHLTGDFVLGKDPGGPWALITIPVFALFVAGALLLAERRSGHVIMLLTALAALGMPILHRRSLGALSVSDSAHFGMAFFFIWGLLALGTTGVLGVILSLRGLLRGPDR